ncbi:uncharacterized protein [Centruroides vittatus]|uniref:uncharacterized protein n=1 Tax=Centruroides vittatus TaxID=120091 RepID=UPI003510BA7E
MFKIFVLLLAVAYVNAHLPIATPCANVPTFSKDIEMSVTRCTEESTVCELCKSKDYTVVIKFTPLKNTSSDMKQKVHGIMGPLTVPYGPIHDVCEDVSKQDDKCCKENVGLIANQSYWTTMSFSILGWFPPVHCTVRFSIEDQRTHEMFACLEVPVKIMSSCNY